MLVAETEPLDHIPQGHKYRVICLAGEAAVQVGPPLGQGSKPTLDTGLIREVVGATRECIDNRQGVALVRGHQPGGNGKVFVMARCEIPTLGISRADSPIQILHSPAPHRP